jgi:hypothetical protein
MQRMLIFLPYVPYPLMKHYTWTTLGQRLAERLHTLTAI